jgi:hypothetical protein
VLQQLVLHGRHLERGEERHHSTWLVAYLKGGVGQVHLLPMRS